ncbi:SDR family oxidoreductase [Paenibacillus athensensis]|uniref:type I polyketide synthase n=1 Tax=Paenibacillus athensensis TaxID=1967502 RepID=UPI001430E352|nr:type I polyketide synthase [Paenibacillus athensensis]MCD1260591.1 SDR family oxidoreductase [Paenibacillus athensensis]
MDFQSIKLGGFSFGDNSDDDEEITLDEVAESDIAVIGIALDLPGADTPERFWRLLRDGYDGVGPLPEARKRDTDRYFAADGRDLAAISYGDAAYLERIDTFDHAFFKISPKEASLFDPNQRLFLQTAWRAIEDAGYGGSRLGGSRTGVYVGYGSDSDYKKMIARLEPEAVPMSMPGNVRPIIASRLSYLMDLKGPSLLVDTTCSSSLVAVHLACQAIRAGECEQALAGGIQVHILPVRELEVGIESSTARTRTFDDASDGTGTGEGSIAILLKPLHKAQEDRDPVYAVIKGSAVNQDGSSVGITAPNADAQEAVIVEAWKRAGVDPRTIGYMEAHGTGTRLGDPIEIEGMQKAFRRYTHVRQFCAVGSVKSNIGHLDNAAGIAGLVKAILSLKYKELFPTLHLSRPNRKIGFEDSPVYINDRLREWESAESHPRRCGVSSFGISGTNCHVVLEEAPPAKAADHAAGGTGGFSVAWGGRETPGMLGTASRPVLFTLSAKTEAALIRLVADYAHMLEEQDELDAADVSYTVNTGRGHYAHRLAIVAGRTWELAESLGAIRKNGLNRQLDAETYYYEAMEAQGEEELRRLGQLASEKLQAYLSGGREETSLLHELSQFYVKGAEIDWDKLYRHEKRRRLNLPAYPFEAQRCWLRLPELAAAQVPEDSGREPLFWKPRWLEQPLNATAGDGDANAAAGAAAGRCLIVGAAEGRAAALAAGLRDLGWSVTLAVKGSRFERLDEHRYSVSSEASRRRSAIEGGLSSGGADEGASREADEGKSRDFGESRGFVGSASGSRSADERSASVDTESEDDCAALLAALAADGGPALTRLVIVDEPEAQAGELAGTLPQEDAADLPEQLERELERTVYGAFRWLRALAASGWTHRIEVSLLTAYADEVTAEQPAVRPAAAALAGLGKALGWECRNVRVRCMDADDATGTEALLAELLSGSTEYKSAYRSGTRYVERIDLAEQPEAKAAVGDDDALRLQADGVYVITGGLGGIALVLAKQLAELAGERGLHLALVGRTPFPPREQWEALAAGNGADKRSRQAGALLALERLGARIGTYAADVADDAQMRELLGQLKARYGAVRGIVHAAGIAEGNLLARLSEAEFRRVMDVKARGAWLLDRLTRDEPVDFFVMCSSAITLVGGLGSGPYTAANAYLDGFAAQRGLRKPRTLAIDWPAWDNTGLSEGEAIEEQKELLRVLPAAAGARAFAAALQSRDSQLIAGRWNPESAALQLGELLPFRLSERAQRLLEADKQAGSGQRAVPALLADRSAATATTAALPQVKLKGKQDSAGYTVIEQFVAAAWRQVLGYEELDVHDSFFEIGGDSILITKVHALIEARYPGRMTIADLFTQHTIAKISAFIRELESPPDHKEQVASTAADADRYRSRLLELLGKLEQGELSVDETLSRYQQLEVAHG